MLPDPNPTNGGTIPGGIITGESGLEDTVNSGQGLTSITPDGAKEAATYYSYSPEDVDLNGKLDNWGGVNIGYGFNVNTNTSPPNPYLTTTCNTIGMANPVSGARHALKLVDGGMSAAGVSYLPVLPPAAACTTTATTDCGGFTIASENPVYVQGNYNTSVSDPFWTNNASNNTPHSAASIIADAVFVLVQQLERLEQPNQSHNAEQPQRFDHLLPHGRRGRHKPRVPQAELGGHILRA